MSETIISIDHVSKEYRLGAIGGGTLRGDLQSLMARLRGKEDPNARIGQDVYTKNQKFLALDDISFSVKKGERVGIIGHNGAGKSTLLKLLSRVTAPTKGTIAYNGRIASMLEVGTGFHPELTGRENVYLNGAILGMTKAEISAKFDDIVRFAEMEKFIDTPVKRYSSGMYVKLAFAVAAHLDSDILVMDEVLAVGDMKFQQKCLGKMDDVSKNEGRTILYVSHNMNTIRQLCSRCIVMDHGKVIFDGEVEEAIEIYMGKKEVLQSRNNCRNTQREAFCDRQVLMDMVEVLTEEEPVIYDQDPLKIRIEYHSSNDFPQLLFRMIIFSSSAVPVGMIYSESYIPTRKGNNTVELLFDVATLAPGQYTGRLVFYEAGDFGAEVIHDVVDPGITFRKEYRDNINHTTITWKGSVWGNICFPSAKLGGDLRC